MDQLFIGEVAARSGLSASALRYYEAEGLLPPPARASGRRRYGPEVFDRLAAIQLAQRAGFTVAEIRVLLEGAAEGGAASSRWHALAARKLLELRGQMARLQAMAALLEDGLACGCIDLESCHLLDRGPDSLPGKAESP